MATEAVHSNDEIIADAELDIPLTDVLNADFYSDQLNQNAEVPAKSEMPMPLWEAMKAYPMAIFWSLVVSMCVVMEGYDMILINNFYAYPTFARKYGTYFPGVGYQLSAAWQAGLGNAAGIGAFIGTLANGYLVNKFGQKPVLIGSLFVLSCFIFMTFFAENILVLCLGELFCGLPWGVFSTASPAYASEVLPMSLRVYLTTYTNMCFIIGQLIAAGVLYSLVDLDTEWSYRIPFALQWIWPALLIPLLFFAPESPWHLVRTGRLEEAEKSLSRLQSKSASIDVKDTLAAIVQTNNLEQELSIGTSYWDCFKTFERRRTAIACLAFAGQVLCGLNFAYNSTYFFQQLGLSTSQTYRLNVGGTGLALLGTIFSWFLLLPYFGRRTIYLWGMATICLILLLIGILNVRTASTDIATTQAALTLVWTFMYQLTIGQIGWAIPAEIGSTRLRQKTVCVARNAYYIVSVIAGGLEPYFMNPTQWNLKGYTALVWSGTSLLTFIWAYFELPETKGRQFEELDILFAYEVPARKFRTFQIDRYGSEQLEDLDVRRLVTANKGLTDGVAG
ncbi:general substrate transporter [Lipomyces kononenkoae]|uniref:General substrate transporter n=1 Tax=Lipomyces kononenkoae TaxID=34357 RepID=A0ACC3STT2_LIPKO